MQIDDDFILAALLAANPKFERALIIKYIHRAPKEDPHVFLLARDVTQRKAYKLGLCGSAAIASDRSYFAFWWRWVKFYEKHGALHTWNSKDMLTSSSTESEATLSTEDTV